MADTKELAKSYTLLNNTQYSAGLFMLNRLDVVPGLRVLDIGCGPGDITAHLCDLVGEKGNVVGIGMSPFFR